MISLDLAFRVLLMFDQRMYIQNLYIYKSMGWCKNGTRTSGSWDQGTPQSLKVGPGTLLRFKSRALGPPLKV